MERVRGILLGTAILTALSCVARAGYSPDLPAVLAAPVSARSTALGGSVFCCEEEGLRYNPAFLAVTGRGSLSATYGLLPQRTGFGGIGIRFFSGGTGFGIGYSEVGTSFDQFTGPDTDSVGTVKVSQSLVSLAAGMAGKDRNLYLGAATRILVDTIGGSSSSGHSLDLGAGYRADRRLLAGLVLGNVVSLYPAADAVPISATFGLRYSPPLRVFRGQDDFSNHIYLSAGRTAHASTVAAGWESALPDGLALRAGFDGKRPAAGVGFRSGPVRLDLAAAFKGGGTLTFFTFGWDFSPASGPAAGVKKTAAAKRAGRGTRESRETRSPKKASPEDTTQVQVNELIAQGWAQLRTGNAAAALQTFSRALALDPASKQAKFGREQAEKRAADLKKKNEIEALVGKGNDLLRDGQYIPAEAAFREALAREPGNAGAQEGIRAAVEGACVEIGEQFKTLSKTQIEFETIIADDALAVSQSGTFPNLVQSLDFLAARKYRDAFREWSKVEPRGGTIVQKYGQAFALLPLREYEGNVQKASRLAAAGNYAEAVRLLRATLEIEGLGGNEKQKTKGIISAYEYVGESIGKNNLAEAEGLIRRGQYRAAETYLNRVVRSGYETDRARELLGQIKGKKDRSIGQGGATGAASGTEGTAPSKSAPSEGSTPGRPQKNKIRDVDPRIKARLLEIYRQKARILAEEGNFRECREYLLKILYLEPGDAEAKKELERVNKKIN